MQRFAPLKRSPQVRLFAIPASEEDLPARVLAEAKMIFVTMTLHSEYL
jgi:hypothetical protein